MPFRRLTQPTIFISASRDMRLEASIAIEVIEEIARRSPAHRNLATYLWSHEDKPWFADTTWQEQIPRPSDPMVLAVICLFGERLGSILPPYFTLPDDLTIPEIVRFPWQEESNQIPLTGTLFEYLDARDGPAHTTAGTAGRKLLVYFRGEASSLAASLPAEQRNWGYWRHYEEVSQSRRHSDISEYFRQIGLLTRFFDEVHRPGERGCVFLAPGPEDFRKTLTRDISDVLGLTAVKKAPAAFKGLEAYDIGDSEIFAGRSRVVDKIFREIERKDASGEGASGAIIVGASGAGKSSVLRAGVIGEALSGVRNTLERTLRAIVVTPQQLGEVHPVAVLGGLLAGQEVLPELGHHDDLEQVLKQDPDRAPEILVARVEKACLIAGEAEKSKSRFGLRPSVRLILGIDQIDQMVEPTAGDGWRLPLLRFIIEGVRRRAFWFVGSLADARLDRWNRLLGEHSSLLEYWPLGNPDWEALSEIVEFSFSLLQIPIHPSLKEILISSCRGMDREGTAILPLLSVAMTRLAEALRREYAEATRAALAEASAIADHLEDVLKLQMSVPETVARLKEFADVKSAIDELAEQARREAKIAVMKQGRPDVGQIGPLLRHLVAVRPGASVESISLVPCLIQDPAVLRAWPLVEALRKRRIITDVRGDRIQIVHEAVVRHWQRAADWFNETQKALGLIETIKPLAHIWASATDRLKRAMLLPAGYCLEVQSILVEWHDDDAGLPIEFIRASLKEHARSIIGLSTESGWYPLGVAALLGETELVETYLTAGADVALGGANGATPLHVASRLAIVTSLLRRGADPKARDVSGSTALHLAAAHGHSDIVVELSKVGSDVHAVDIDGNTALHRAAEGRHFTVAEVLLHEGLAVNQYNSKGTTPFTLACRLGDAQMMSLFLDAGADITLPEHSQGADLPAKLPLELTVESGTLPCVELLIGDGVSSGAGAAALLIATSREADFIVRQLIHSGAPVNYYDIVSGLTPLHLAAQSGNEAVIDTLLDAGADPQAVGKKGFTVLHAAVMSGVARAVEQIASCGVAIDQPTAGGETAMHLASKNKGCDIIRLLLRFGARADIEDSYGFTALGRAVYYSDAACAAALLEGGSAALHMNVAGLSPLHIAARHGRTELMYLLAGAGDLPAGLALGAFAVHSGSPEAVSRALELCASIDAPDARGMTALMYAAWYAMDDIVALLLAKGADPNRRGPEGWSALMFATSVSSEAAQKALSVINRLLAAGASPNTRDQQGRDARAIALLFGFESLAKALEAAPVSITVALP